MYPERAFLHWFNAVAKVLCQQSVISDLASPLVDTEGGHVLKEAGVTWCLCLIQEVHHKDSRLSCIFGFHFSPPLNPLPFL